MHFTDFWCVLAESAELRGDSVLARSVLGERLACFRGADENAAVLPDRCLHRNAPLSLGRVHEGTLACPYHDIPHTAFVHTGIFRTTQGQRIVACVERDQGAVHVVYRNERANLGTWRRFLNPRGDEIRHTDSFYVPNVTCVTYEIGKRTFIITSQSVPAGADDGGDTLVYTDLTFDFGAFNDVARPFVHRYGQRVILDSVRCAGRARSCQYARRTDLGVQPAPRQDRTGSN